jgi:hypothetical protein
MVITEYGEGGYDPSKPNDNIINQSETITDLGDDPIIAPVFNNEVTIPVAALTTLIGDLDDPAINSIAKVKDALKDFFQSVKGGSQ